MGTVRLAPRSPEPSAQPVSNRLRARLFHYLPHPHRRQSAWAEFSVADGVPNIPMAEEFLDQAGVHALVGEEVARRVPQHVRVSIDIQAGFLPASRTM